MSDADATVRARTTTLDDYWRRAGQRLHTQFEHARADFGDSDVKGGYNERIVAEFLKENTGARRVATNSEIMNATGVRSDEVDVAVLNDVQPLWSSGGSQELLIAEGVDVVYQVKARLTTSELGRAVKNAASVKRVTRDLNGRLLFAQKESDVPRFVDRVPYIVVAFDSEITAETSGRVLADALTDTPIHEQPDAVFVVGKWTLMNVGDNQGRLKLSDTEGGVLAGFVSLDATDYDPLTMMLWCHYLMPPRVPLISHPLDGYYPPRHPDEVSDAG